MDFEGGVAAPSEMDQAMREAITTASFQCGPDLLRVFDTARRFVAYREREVALAAGRLPPPRTLSEAIDRDFLAFELRRAERELREAVSAAEPVIHELTGTDP
jgi:hypothetical protein